jgi:hypothetical protein
MIKPKYLSVWLPLCLLAFLPETIFSQSTKPRIFILTDIGGDADDQQSLVRFLVHANLFRVEGIGTTSRLEHGKDTRPDLVLEQLEAYGQVHANLSLHAPDFPDPSALKARVRPGLGDETAMGEGFDTPASEFLIERTDAADEPLWVSIWGGQRELAQALWKVQQTRSAEALAAFVAKIRVYAIGNQDGHQRWIMAHFPQLFFISSGFIQLGYPHTQKIREYSCYRGQYMTGDLALTSRDWVQTHVKQVHGPLGMLYPLDGDGVQGMKEGDTPAFLCLVANGLNIPGRPEWGSYGGRFRKLWGGWYTDDRDFVGKAWNERFTVSRWRPYFQNDFQARMDWCTQPYAQANHHPAIVLEGIPGTDPLEITARPGQTLRLSAKGTTDPDGHALRYTWWHYLEAGNYLGSLPIKGSNTPMASVKIPGDAAGTTLHLILEVTDQGTPFLTSFRRIVINVTTP